MPTAKTPRLHSNRTFHPVLNRQPLARICRNLLFGCGMAGLAISASAEPANVSDQPAAATGAHEQIVHLAIAPASLRDALQQLAQQGHVHLKGLNAVPDVQSEGLSGDFSISVALKQLLAQSGLAAVRLAPGQYRLQPASRKDATELEAVQSTAHLNSDEVSYTASSESSATRLPISLRETPQSVTVITRAQMDDFGLNNINAVLANTTGINVEAIETDRTYYSARGFDVTNFLYDGVGVPLTFGLLDGDLDTAVYERVEVLRGADGLLSFIGNPSATVNFIRKRPTAEEQGSVGVTVGSWNDRRFDLDVSGPLNTSRSVRGRLIAVDDHSDSYLDRYSHKKQVVSAIVEADLSPSTLLTAGVTYQRNSPHGVMWGSLPLAYTDGSATNYSRSTSSASNWSYWNTYETRSFLELSQQLGGDWKLKATLNADHKVESSQLFYVYGTPDADTGLGIYAYPSAYHDSENEYVADVAATGSLPLFGRDHEVVVGADWARTDTSELSSYGEGIGTELTSPLDNWNGDYTKPPFDASYSRADFHINRRTLYATVRWHITDALTLITGDSLTHISATGESYGVPYVFNATKNTPFAGLVYDLGPNYSIYASYTKIFNPQTDVDINNKVLAPVTGSNLEAGLKGAWFNNRLNASFALFQTKQNNYAESEGYNTATGAYYYKGINATSRGYEFEVSGQLTPNWQANGGFTQLGIVDESGANVRTYVPRETLHLSSTYRFPQLPNLKVGATLRWQDRIYRDLGETTTNGSEIFRSQGSYTLLGLMAHYDFGRAWNATFNINNVTNRKYITSLYDTQGYYGAPRSYMLNVTYRF